MSNKKSSKSQVFKHSAANLSATRGAHALEGIEDYLEAICGLVESEGEARVVSVSRQMGVSHVAVVKMVARLQRAGYVIAEPYRSIFLTDKGRKLAIRVRKRHELVVRFLRVLGVSEAAAERDAEGIEHHVSAETVRAFKRYIVKYDKA